MSSVPVYRFAPSPNGLLHLGHAYSAILNHDLAQRSNGRFLLRIEDIDVGRAREEFVTAIFDDLTWLGLRWEHPVLHQSRHFARYQAAAEQLKAMGLLYPCFATRAEIAAASRPSAGTDPDGAPIYPGLHRDLSNAEIAARHESGDPFALRLDMARAIEVANDKLSGLPLTFIETDCNGCGRCVDARPERWGDAVIVRKDTPASYHLSVVVDDAWQGVTNVVRGQDLFAATDIHRLLQVLLDLPQPVYLHHRLVCADDGRKLSKSTGARSVATLRASGASPADLRNCLDLSGLPQRFDKH